jgi:flagellar hook-length control protein FliK
MVHLLQNAAVQPAQNRGGGNNNRGNRGGAGDFDSLMSNLGAANAETPARPDAPVRRNENAQSARNESQQPTTPDVQNPQNPQNAANQPDNAAENAQNADTTTVDGVANEATYDQAALTEVIVDENALLAELAAALGITMEALAELIQKMEMPLKDLLLAENRMELLLAAKGLQNQIELLNYPEALPTLQKLAQTVETYTAAGSYNPNLLDEQALEAELPTDMLEVLTEEVATTESRSAPTATTAQTADFTAEIPMEMVEQVVQTASQAASTVDTMPQIAVMPTIADAPITTAQTADITPHVPMQNISPQNIVNQIIQNVRFISGEQMAEIRIMLKPEQLGDLSMRIATQNGIVTAQFIADSQRVKELIEAGFDLLRDALEQAGINVADIEVNVRNEGGYHDFENEVYVSDGRILDLLNADIEGLEEVVTVEATEENLVDYRI